MLTFSQTPRNVLKIDYDNIVIDENMRNNLKYKILKYKVWYDRKGKTMLKKKSGNEAVATPRAKTLGVASRPKKNVKPKAATSKSKKVGKSAIISKGMVIPKGEPVDAHTLAVLAKVTELGNGSTEASGKETFAASALTIPIKVADLGKESADAYGRKLSTTSPEGHSAGITQAPGPDVINIEDEPGESGRKVPLVRNAAKCKWTEKVRESPKKAHFALDPQTYALVWVSEAELLFGRPRFVLPMFPSYRRS